MKAFAIKINHTRSAPTSCTWSYNTFVSVSQGPNFFRVGSCKCLAQILLEEMDDMDDLEAIKVLEAQIASLNSELAEAKETFSAPVQLLLDRSRIFHFLLIFVVETSMPARFERRTPGGRRDSKTPGTKISLNWR